jgi:Tetratricopeptide repeat
MGEPEGPEDRARLHWSVPPPPPGAEHEAISPSAIGEEFLFHLYRGSELLQEDQVYEAKSELERALSLQPQDVEGQSLLGIVYFRLGHYPRAIQIYESLVRARPEEVAPRVNLALCFLKTGQLPQAKLLLEEIVQHRPDHSRAWGYLGLSYQRLGDYEKASIAFDRAGRPNLAARVRAAHDSGQHSSVDDDAEPEPTGSSRIHEIAQKDARAAPSVPPPAEPPRESISAQQPIRPSAGAPAPAPGTRVSLPPRLWRLAAETALVFPERPRVAVHQDGAVLVRIERSFNARSDCIRAMVSERPSALKSSVLKRRGRSVLSDEPLGGITGLFATLEGAGRLVLGAPESLSPMVTAIDGEPFYVREARLIGFDGSVEHEAGRLPLGEGEYAGLVHLAGTGFIVIATRGRVSGLEVSSDRPVIVRAERLIGWAGRLLAHPVPSDEAPAQARGLVSLSGAGTVLFDGG